MIGTVAVTDFGWYRFLSELGLAEVNFWTPSDRRRFSAPELSPFFFKLKAPHRAIAGFAFYAKWSSLPPWLAWECFGQGNGCESLDEFEARLAEIRTRIRYTPSGPLANVGCILLLQPRFFPSDAWIPQPSDWHDRTVSSEQYDLTSGEGRRIWDACRERAGLSSMVSFGLPQVTGPAGPRYGAPQVIAPRLGQGTFRVAVTDAYDRSCAATGEHSLPALEAAHIRSYSRAGPHEVRNGVLLRADLHRLLDKGYLTITREHSLEVSPRLRADYSNGRAYYPLHGQAIRIPHSERDQPALEFIEWHNQNVYRP